MRWAKTCLVNGEPGSRARHRKSRSKEASWRKSPKTRIASPAVAGRTSTVDEAKTPWQADKAAGDKTPEPEAPSNAETVESIEPEPVPRPEETPKRQEPEAKSAVVGSSLPYLVLFLIVVGGPIGLLAWNPVIQPKINEIADLGLPKFYPFGKADQILKSPRFPSGSQHWRTPGTEPALPAEFAETVASLEAAIATFGDRVNGLASDLQTLADTPALKQHPRSTPPR